ncbi:hypothetical protein Ahy_A04g018687 isoform E [Arachis hypogaea]|uniref:Thioredoxin domain-containing protein n=1 Tax=Arachis hypogaea TaxID=3818 RepID=A0A445DEB3_ARAHY|nr:hypothetical protein Ahy_A04g018687 isoform E [Arachis hypogaea]
MESNTLDKNERNWADEGIPPVRLGLREKVLIDNIKLVGYCSPYLSYSLFIFLALQKFVLQNLVVFPLKLQNLWLLNNYMGNCLDKDESTDTHSDQHVELASGNVKLISSSEAWEQKLEEATRDGKTVILNFSATWCGPCKMIAPYYCELSEKFTSIVFLIVDVDELSDFAATWDIKATPTFFFFQNGQQVDKLVGANKPELQKKIAAITDSVPKWQ